MTRAELYTDLERKEAELISRYGASEDAEEAKKLLDEIAEVQFAMMICASAG